MSNSQPDLPHNSSPEENGKTVPATGSQQVSASLFAGATQITNNPSLHDMPRKVEKTACMAVQTPSSLSITMNLSSAGVELDPAEPLPAGEQQPASMQAEESKYHVLRELGRGGMGKVLLWKDNNIGRLVATKMLLVSKSPDTVQRFYEEGQITGQLEHPNIVPIHEMEVDSQGNLYFTMKYVKGHSLKELLQDIGKDRQTAQAWSLNKMLQIFLSICNAVSYAHSKKVIHRDLKPENVMLGNFGEVLVMDWGLAKVLGQGHEVLAGDAVKTLRSEGGFRTITGQIAGTPLYMSPEQADGRLEDIDARTDIYALGAILYEIVTGTTCVENRGNIMTILCQVVQGQVRPLPEKGMWGIIGGELKSIIYKALAHKREDRYQTVQELADDVQRLLEGKQVAAYQYSPFDKLYRLARQYRREIAAGVATVLVVVPLFLFWHYQQSVVEAEKIMEIAAAEEKQLDAFFAVESERDEANKKSSVISQDNNPPASSETAPPVPPNPQNITGGIPVAGESPRLPPRPQRKPTAPGSGDEKKEKTGSTLVEQKGGGKRDEPHTPPQKNNDGISPEKDEEVAQDMPTKKVHANDIAPAKQELQTKREAFSKLQKAALKAIEQYKLAYQKNPDYRFKKREADVWRKIYNAATLIGDKGSVEIARFQIKNLLTPEDYARMEPHLK